jgi:hypothetical protein
MKFPIIQILAVSCYSLLRLNSLLTTLRHRQSNTSLRKDQAGNRCTYKGKVVPVFFIT